MDPENALREMLATLEGNQNTKADKVYHLIVSFPLGENPTGAVLDDIEDKLIASIDMSGHQRIRAVHNDTSHRHMHIAIVKIHPESGRNVTPFQTYPKLAAAARELERRHGLQVLVTGKGEDRERIRAAITAEGATWETIQEDLDMHGMQLARRGRGLVIQTDKGILKASEVDPGMSRQKLEELLGPLPADVPRLQEPEMQPENPGAGPRKVEPESNPEKIRICIEGILSSEDPTWAALQAALGKLGLQISPRGRGLAVTSHDGTVYLKASEVDRSMSRQNLENALGKFPTVSSLDRKKEEPDSQDGPGSRVKAVQPEYRPEKIRACMEAALTREGVTWTTLQEALGEIGLMIRPKGRGFTIESPDGTVSLKPSSLDRALSRQNLEERLGPMPKDLATAAKRYFPQRLEEANVPKGKSLYQQYKAEEESRRAVRKQLVEKYKDRKTLAWDILKGKHAASRKRIWGETTLTKKEKFEMNRKNRIEKFHEMTELRKDLARERKEIQIAAGARTWVTWLQEKASEGYAPALMALHRRRDRKKEMTDIASEESRRLQPGASQRMLPELVDAEIRFKVSTIGDIQVQADDGEVKIVVREDTIHLCDLAEEFRPLANRLVAMSRPENQLEQEMEMD